jgi:hypothetical protein
VLTVLGISQWGNRFAGAPHNTKLLQFGQMSKATMPLPPTQQFASTAAIARSVAAVRESHSILDVFRELILAEPDVGGEGAHGRIDVSLTLAAATRRARRKATKKQRSSEFDIRKTRLPSSAGGRRSQVEKKKKKKKKEKRRSKPPARST